MRSQELILRLVGRTMRFAMEIKSTKQFIAFIVAFVMAGAAWLWGSAKVINRLIRRR